MPTHAKSFGSGVIGILSSLTLFTSVKTVPTLVENLELHGMFLMNCIINVVTIVICYFVLPETSGLTLEEIEDNYRPKSKKRFVSQDTK